MVEDELPDYFNFMKINSLTRKVASYPKNIDMNYQRWINLGLDLKMEEHFGKKNDFVFKNLTSIDVDFEMLSKMIKHDVTMPKLHLIKLLPKKRRTTVISHHVNDLSDCEIMEPIFEITKENIKKKKTLNQEVNNKKRNLHLIWSKLQNLLLKN